MEVEEIKLSEIAPSSLNPRKTFDAEELNELAQSIDTNGLIQPITLRQKAGENGIKYEIVCGERRFRAVKLLGRETIQAVVKDLDDKQAFACMVIENLQRANIDPMEEAQALRSLYNKGAVPVKEIAKILGKSQSFVISRIQLNNAIPEFVELMRNGNLTLANLQTISNLRKDQQRMLLELHFQPAHIERWPSKTPKQETLKAWIDESVMGLLSTALFDPADETYASCKDASGCASCKGCKFCTATFPARFKDTDNPRCMNIELFRQKNREALLRKAKESGLPLVYAGSKEENSAIIEAANAVLLYPQPLGTREYLVVPTPPERSSFSDEEKYNIRLQSYEMVRAVFDDNLKAGTIAEVFEIAYNGNLSGERKYLYNVPTNSECDADQLQSQQAAQLTEIRTKLRTIDDQKKEARVEMQRAFIDENKSYSEQTQAMDATEENIFLALLSSRLPAEFRKNIGLGFESAVDVTKSFDTLQSHKSSIHREFIRVMLADKQVCYSPGFAGLLDLTMQHHYSKDAHSIDAALKDEYEKKCKTYESQIATLEASLKEAREKASQAAEESAEAESPTEAENEPQEASNEASDGVSEESSDNEPSDTESAETKE